MGCPTNQNKMTNMLTDSQGIMRKGPVLGQDTEPIEIPTLIGKPERIAALNSKIAADEKAAGMVGVISAEETPTQYKTLSLGCINCTSPDEGISNITGNTKEVAIVPDEGKAVSTTGITATNCTTAVSDNKITLTSITGNVVMTVKCSAS